VWEDSNEDGINGIGEPLLENITVWLMKDNGSLIDEIETGTGGRYVFDNLSDGDYYLKISPPSEFAFTEMDLGSDDDSDSDFSDVGETDIITLSGETVERHVDAGLKRISKFSSTVYPNPTTQGSVSLRIQSDQNDDEATLLIFDEQGKIKSKLPIDLQGNMDNTVEIDISHLSAGFYYLKINQKRSSQFLKLIKLE